MTRVKKVYGDFDLQKALGTQGIQNELAALERSFQALSDHYGIQQAEVTKIGAAWAAAGASGIALAKGTELTLKAMVLGEMDATKATEALISIQSQWHLSTEGMNTTLAELNIIENQTATSMQDLIEAFTRASGVARNAGVTTRELERWLRPSFLLLDRQLTLVTHSRRSSLDCSPRQTRLEKS